MAKASRSKRSPAATLPKRHPKKTGKAGIGPAPEQPDAVQELGHLVKDEPADIKKPRQARLPQMEDPIIEELERAAKEYADVRDRRMALTTDEVGCKEELLSLMDKHGKSSYVHNGYDIKVVVESKKIKVRIKKDE